MTENIRQDLNSPSKEAIDARERQLVARGYRAVPPLTDLQPLQYYRTEGIIENQNWAAQKTYSLFWREPDA